MLKIDLRKKKGGQEGGPGGMLERIREQLSAPKILY